MGGGRYTEEGATLDPLTCYEVTLGSELQLLQEPFLRMRKLQAQAHSGSHGAVAPFRFVIFDSGGPGNFNYS